MTDPARTPGLGRRLLCLVYEALLLTALVLVAGGLATALAQLAPAALTRTITQLVLAAAVSGYFIGQWHGRGQTLPMKTWRLRMVARAGGPVTVPRAALRLALACAGYALCGLSILWAAGDRDRQFLHDRLAGTRIVSA